VVLLTLVGLAAPAAADDQVPFTLHGTGVVAGVMHLPGGLTQVDFSSSGTATHLGSYTGPVTRIEGGEGRSIPRLSTSWQGGPIVKIKLVYALLFVCLFGGRSSAQVSVPSGSLIVNGSFEDPAITVPVQLFSSVLKDGAPPVADLPARRRLPGLAP